MITSRIEVTPRYAETNQMGTVAEAAYPRWFDMARAALLKEQGLDYRQFEALGYIMPVLEIGLTFHEPAYYDDLLQITTTLKSRPYFKIRLEYEIWRAGTLLVNGYSIQAFINRRHRPVKPPPVFMATLDAIFPRIAASAAQSHQNSTAGP